MIFLSKSEKDTRKIAGNLATKIIKSPTSPRLVGLRRASVVTLEGELGAGKTTFVKGFAKALGIKAKIKSPTFNLMKEYKIPRNSISHIPYPIFLVHLDCYRVRDHRDLAILDLKSIFNSPDSIVLIEWPERISKILPKKIIRVHIDHIDKNKRKIRISKPK
ncbi:MAG: tRNA (adenosine(37)-N6)-threonylcarbamoyltransferase complex ATPase subunit type 1 TsaE [Candidatus Yanofskybacteria bacterium RIFCSPHIGHO2_01_FULL_43_42]|uniref:tRNA threonylcarbamoyladenosine biosynthesis protein TsaE n=1 Tax=Candidatus Yanofskybacteria bacterium RIFCSPLOWO2_01_FULL_43_22 TaxID=1802695 RepID=A0A1F8GGM3_9BACT|nr:MAG: tRNA (adenosine(37)-N6)-threonylcarbamoyltransferase complex ATPase subunit type 1 TsaE [Candidatus Yanofskybacteria bacterium RIFCSPHIGHO2_01_FULL_43_42]OGN12797.1 MAG: tRNA (adenosine(37)-N6)-threonylcarbamoyltransferase complex ATPase subunit type 1 TsaE [Candidatus Yanofskybacteria bacterium RIFCSPHIGHO2_02_FULL_43_17]OGN23868.1 MAG: tRNA (adenosine(37)-N6)-threonylcarbamoyltransferase complex ATPase subunit type 1 TsaE [Candidatus Yanofskybacteria bacterium RIFCSPLOWO2_01_FULL_43_22]